MSGGREELGAPAPEYLAALEEAERRIERLNSTNALDPSDLVQLARKLYREAHKIQEAIVAERYIAAAERAGAYRRRRRAADG